MAKTKQPKSKLQPERGPQAVPSAPTFIDQLYKIVTTESQDLIRYERGFIYMWDPPTLAKEVLPKYFRHSRFDSFQRQLTKFRFHKVHGRGKLAPCVYLRPDLLDRPVTELKALSVSAATQPATKGKRKRMSSSDLDADSTVALEAMKRLHSTAFGMEVSARATLPPPSAFLGVMAGSGGGFKEMTSSDTAPVPDMFPIHHQQHQFPHQQQQHQSMFAPYFEPQAMHPSQQQQNWMATPSPFGYFPMQQPSPLSSAYLDDLAALSSCSDTMEDLTAPVTSSNNTTGPPSSDEEEETASNSGEKSKDDDFSFLHSPSLLMPAEQRKSLIPLPQGGTGAPAMDNMTPGIVTRVFGKVYHLPFAQPRKNVRRGEETEQDLKDVAAETQQSAPQESSS